MTVQEAKNQIEYNVKYRIFTPRVEALQIAIECMEKVEQYRALGTVEELKEAKKLLEKLEELKFANEQSKTDWIPCEERLPEPNIAVLVSTNTGEVDVDYYGAMVKDFIGLKGTHQKAIAWQPLPQPYKKEGAE